jgi:hypothetical protein
MVVRHHARNDRARTITALFAWLISHQPAVLLSQNKPAISNQPTVIFSQNKPAPAISHTNMAHMRTWSQPNEQGDVYRVGGTSALFPTRMPSCENENESI